MKLTIILAISLLLGACGSVYEGLAGSYTNTADQTETLTLKADKTFSDTGHGGFSGTYSVSGDTITFVSPGISLNTRKLGSNGIEGYRKI
jgi:hypothetical protein